MVQDRGHVIVHAYIQKHNFPKNYLVRLPIKKKSNDNDKGIDDTPILEPLKEEIDVVKKLYSRVMHELTTSIKAKARAKVARKAVVKEFDKSGHKKIVSPSQKSINNSISITSSPSKNSLSKNVSVDDVSHKSLEGFKSETQSSISQSFSSSPSSPAAELSALLLKVRENEIPLQSPVPDSLNNSQYEASVSEMNSSTVSRSLLSSQLSKYLAPSSPAVLGNYESRSTPKNLESPLYVSSNRSTLISPSVNNSSLSSLSKSLHRIESSATKVAASMRMNLSRSLLSSPNKSIHISQDGTNLESNEIMNDELINETNRSLESNSLMSGIITPKYKIMNNSYSSPIKTSLFIHSYIIM